MEKTYLISLAIMGLLLVGLVSAQDDGNFDATPYPDQEYNEYFNIMPYGNESSNRTSDDSTISYDVEIGIVTIGTENIDITLRSPEGGSSIGNTGILETGTTAVVYSTELAVVDSKLVMKTSVGQKQINILPKQAIEILETTKEKIISMELKEESEKPIYLITEEKVGKIIGIFSITSEIKTKIDAEDGTIIGVEKPWYSFLVLGF